MSFTASDAGDGTSEQLTGLLETDAAIVAGDSGGPLVDGNGHVVGMDTAASAGFRFSQTSQGYAIPIARAVTIAREIESGSASETVHIGPTALLGVGIAPTGSYPGAGAGAVVAQVVGGGAADRAGIVAGDTIVAVAGRQVSSAEDLSRVVLQQTPGTTVAIAYLDQAGTRHTTSATLTSGPPQ